MTWRDLWRNIRADPAKRRRMACIAMTVLPLLLMAAYIVGVVVYLAAVDGVIGLFS